MRNKNNLLNLIVILAFVLIIQATFIGHAKTFEAPFLSGASTQIKEKEGIQNLAQIYDLHSSVSAYTGELYQSIDTGTLYGAQLGASASGVISTNKWSPNATGKYSFEFDLDINGNSKLHRFTYLQGAWISSSVKMVFQVTNVDSGKVVASDSLNLDSRVLPTKTTLMLDLAGKSAGLVHAALSSKVSSLAAQHPDKKIYAVSKARYALVGKVSNGLDFVSILDSLFGHSKELDWNGTFFMTDISLRADQKYQIACFLRSVAVHNAIIESSSFVDTEIDAKINKIDVTQGEVSNHSPKARAGSKITAKKGTEVRLDGKNSNDPDGDKLAYNWEGPGLDEDSAVAEFTPQFTGTKEYTLTVDDGQLQDETSVKVTVQPRIPPKTSITVKPNKSVSKKNVTFKWEGKDDCTDSSEMVYSYKLEGVDYEWSPWSKTTKAVYDDLANGNYTFNVKAKDEVGNEETDPASYTFNVELPGSLKVDVSSINGTRFESGVLNQKVSLTNKGEVELKDVKVSAGGEVSDWMQITSSESDWDASTNSFPSIPCEIWADYNRTFQLSVSIPDDVNSGNYEGEIVISTKTPNTSKVKIPVSIEILEKGEGTEEAEIDLSDEDHGNWDVQGKRWKDDGTWGRVWEDSFNIDSEEFDNLQSAKLHFKYKGMTQGEAEEDPMAVYFNGKKIGELPTTNDWQEYTLNLSLDDILKQDNKVKVRIKKQAEDSYSIYNLSKYGTELIYVYLEPGDTDLDISNDKISVNKGETFTVNGTVFNDGGKEATNAEISIDYDTNLFEKVKGQKTRSIGKLNPAESFSSEWVFKALRDGKHELNIECSSDQDDKDSSTITVKVSDATPPETSLEDGPKSEISRSDVKFQWSGTDDSTSQASMKYSYKLIPDGTSVEWSDWTSKKSKSYSGLNEGSYTFKVRAKDEAGNVDNSPSSRTFSVKFEEEVRGFEVTYSNNNASHWFGGDDREAVNNQEWEKRNVGIGQGLILDRSVRLDSFAFRFSQRFDYDGNPERNGHSVTLVLNVREEDGNIISTYEKFVPSSFDGGWVEFNIDDKLEKNKKYIFTCYLKNGAELELSTGVLAWADSDSPSAYSKGHGYRVEIKDGEGSLRSWNDWSPHHWDFNFKLEGEETNPSAPTANSDTYTVPKNSQNNTFDVLSNDSDPDGEAISLDKIASSPDHGSASIDGGKINYTPDTDYTGSDSFTYRISDTEGNSDTGRVDITVEGGTTSVQLTISDAHAAMNQTATPKVTLSRAPDGLSSFNITVSVTDTSVAEFTDASISDRFSAGTHYVDVAEDGSWIRIAAGDFGENVDPGATDIGLATLKVKVKSQSTATVSVDSVDELLNNNGDPINAATSDTGKVGFIACPKVKGGEGPPKSNHGKPSLLDDVNGDGTTNTYDAFVLFKAKVKGGPVVTGKDHSHHFDFNEDTNTNTYDAFVLFKKIVTGNFQNSGTSSVAKTTTSHRGTSGSLTRVVEINLNHAPEGLVGYKLSAKVPEGNVEAVDLVAFDGARVVEGLNSPEATFAAADFDQKVEPGSSEVTLARLKVSGNNPVELKPYWLDDDTGSSYDPNAVDFTLKQVDTTKVPLKLESISAHPNPLTDRNSISFTVNGENIAASRLEVFGLNGKTIHDSGFVAGNRVGWSLQDEQGARVSNGIYLYRMTAQGFDGELAKSKVRRVLVLK